MTHRPRLWAVTGRVTLARRRGSDQQVSAALSAAAVCRAPPGSAGSTLQSVLPCCLALEMELLENSLGEKMYKLIIKKKTNTNSDFYSKYQQFAIYTYERWRKRVYKSFNWRIKTKLKAYTNSSTATAARAQSSGPTLSCSSYYSPPLNWKRRSHEERCLPGSQTPHSYWWRVWVGADHTGISLICSYKFSLQTRFMSWIIWQTLKFRPVFLPTCQPLQAAFSFRHLILKYPWWERNIRYRE